jgi:hypothetical protein
LRKTRTSARICVNQLDKLVFLASQFHVDLRSALRYSAIERHENLKFAMVKLGLCLYQKLARSDGVDRAVSDANHNGVMSSADIAHDGGKRPWLLDRHNGGALCCRSYLRLGRCLRRWGRCWCRGLGVAHLAALPSLTKASRASIAAMGTRNSRPMRIVGMSPRRAASYEALRPKAK